MKKSINITSEGSRVIVRVDRFTESFDTEYMDEREIIERVRWTLVTGNTILDGLTIRELLREIGILRP